MKSSTTYYAIRLKKFSDKFAKRCKKIWGGEPEGTVAVDSLSADYGNYLAWCSLNDPKQVLRGRVLFEERGAKQSLGQIRKGAEADGFKPGVDFDVEIVPINITLEMAD
jgi:hypothetical protein